MLNVHRDENGTLYWDSMLDFYADTARFIRLHVVEVPCEDNQARIRNAVSMARIDTRTEPLPPETPDFLKLVRLYVNGEGGLRYAKSVIETKLERLGPPDYYLDPHAEQCGCELCEERGPLHGPSTRPLRHDPERGHPRRPRGPDLG